MKFSKELPTKLEIIPQVIDELLGQIDESFFGKNDAFHIKLCLEEALVNAMKHGNKLNPDFTVNLAAEADSEALLITIVNQGDGFEHESIDDPTKEHNLRKPSGRGVFIIKTEMDEVEFFDQGRGLKMTKFFNKEK
ncbi:MAG: ATP-binding protein [Candidatus Aceula meridiana]|nr:ATP-binding protein [Candidatus Aceula meridiana]